MFVESLRFLVLDRGSTPRTSTKAQGRDRNIDTCEAYVLTVVTE